MKQLPPYPSNDLKSWATQLYDYLVSQSPVKGSVEPTPVLLSHTTANQLPRASTDGVMLYDPQRPGIVVAEGGEWLEVLSGVVITSPVDKAVLMWDNPTQRWVDGISAGDALAAALTATVTELNYTDGVTSPIQTQLDGKQPLNPNLTALAALSGTGLVTRTGVNTFIERSVTSADSSVVVTNPAGIVGNIDLSVGAVTDAKLDTGPATAAGITWVGLRTAGLAVGAVGSYAMLSFATAINAAPGSTHAGSNLLYSNGGNNGAATAPAGTWRLMGRITTGVGGNSSVFLRIS